MLKDLWKNCLCPFPKRSLIVILDTFSLCGDVDDDSVFFFYIRNLRVSGNGSAHAQLKSQLSFSGTSFAGNLNNVTCNKFSDEPDIQYHIRNNWQTFK